MRDMRALMLRICIVLTICAGFAPAAVAEPSNAKTVYARAKALFEAGRFDEAAATFLEAYAITRKPMLLFNAAQAYRKANRRTDAISTYRWFIEEGAESPELVA